jgi:chorismate synthase
MFAYMLLTVMPTGSDAWATLPLTTDVAAFKHAALATGLFAENVEGFPVVLWASDEAVHWALRNPDGQWSEKRPSHPDLMVWKEFSKMEEDQSLFMSAAEQASKVELVFVGQPQRFKYYWSEGLYVVP